MSGSALALARAYEIHGVGLTVASEEPAVVDAMELRLQTFRRETIGQSEIRLEFLLNGHAEDKALSLPPGASRPVYETPYGHLHYFPEADTVCGDFQGVRVRCEAGDGVARLHSTAFAGSDLYLATHPLATISLMELLKHRDRYSLHAACVAESDGRGILVAGPSGAGKSTLTIALVRAGLGFLSDDIVFLRHDPAADAVQVLAFPDAVGVTPHTAERFGDLRALLAEQPPSGFPKRLVRMEELFETRALSSCEPRVLVFPEVVRDRPSRLDPLDPKEALLRLVPDVLLTQPAGTQSHLRALAALLARVRCYRLQSGADLEGTAQLVRELL
jgi:hypothetical protein